MLPGENAKAGHFRRFLAELRRHLQRPLVVIWDRLAAHRARALCDALDRSGRVHLEFLPPYALELNQVEMLWGNVMMTTLANHPATDAFPLADRAKRHFTEIRCLPDLLRSFLLLTPLFSRLD